MKNFNLNSQKSLTRDEMRLVSGGLRDPNEGGYCDAMKQCNWDSWCPSECPKCLATSDPNVAGYCGTA